MSDKWCNHNTARHLDGAVLVTARPGEGTGLLTVRGKALDLTAAACDALAATFTEAAERLRGEIPAREALNKIGGTLRCLLDTYDDDGDFPDTARTEIAECLTLAAHALGLGPAPEGDSQ